MGYLLRTDAGEWRSLVAIIGHDELKAHLGLVSNRIADWQPRGQLKTLVRESLLGLLSERSSLTHPSVPQLLRNVCQGCDLGIGTFLRLAKSSVLGRENEVRDFLSTRLKRITVKPFMDIHTMLEERLLQCCVHVGAQGDGGEHQCAPFCAMQAWAGLTATKLSARAEVRSLAVVATPNVDTS